MLCKLFQNVCIVKLVAIFIHSRMFIGFVLGTVQGLGIKIKKRSSSWL